MALLIVLLAGASLMLRSLGNLASIDAGFDAERVLSIPLRQLPSRYESNASVVAFADRLLSSVQGRPGVAGAAMAWPFDYTGFTWAPSINFTVAQRAPEIGVRLALGANRGDVVKLLILNSLYPVSAGGAAGLLAVVPLSRAFRSYLYGISPGDPVSLAAAAAILLVAAIAAAYVPARRASGIDPLRALRAQ